jgi:hypothetical protein
MLRYAGEAEGVEEVEEVEEAEGKKILDFRLCICITSYFLLPTPYFLLKKPPAFSSLLPS